MINYASIVFAIAAAGGLFLAAHTLRDKFAPWAVSLLHAGLGALGLGLLVAALLQGASQIVLIGFAILLLAAVVGFFLASFHLRKSLPPKVAVVAHAGIAVAGFLIILSQVF